MSTVVQRVNAGSPARFGELTPHVQASLTLGAIAVASTPGATPGVAAAAVLTTAVAFAIGFVHGVASVTATGGFTLD